MSGEILENKLSQIEWAVSDNLVDYNDAVRFMEERVAAISKGEANELIWLLEHPAIYTAGTSAKPSDLAAPDRFPVIQAGRGGQYTYHGPGQRVAYVMLNVGKRGKDVRAFVYGLEQWIINSLKTLNVTAERREGRVGVWVDRTASGGPLKEDKIAAIGVRLRKWVSFHGISLNVEPNLEHFSGIIPCGISEDGLGVTSLFDLGNPITMPEVDALLRQEFTSIFGDTIIVPPPFE